ncbi:hypothetical protein [Rossellomorea vietnamensis]|uniref:hypothetical protein n=1 Tax=Rossellomorea vietnamensis TaxID=218284 RepID=UPI001653D4A0|nr:hypothetical protein [Rossellomorea vietnamensis]
MPYFDTKNGIVYAPENPELYGLYLLLKKHYEVLGNSKFYDDLIQTYESLDQSYKEKK